MIEPIHYPVRVAAVKRKLDGKRKVLDVVDSKDRHIAIVFYEDRTNDLHTESMRVAHAIADALNACEINILTDGKPKEQVTEEDPWKRRALAAESELRRMNAVNRAESDRALRNSWELSNLREEQQRRRDAEIGRMGGGG